MEGNYKTRDGRPVRILAIDLKSINPVAYVVGYGEEEFITKVSAEGYALLSEKEHPYDLIEVSKYDHFKKGDVVLVSCNKGYKYLSFFIGLTSNNKVVTSNYDTFAYTSIWDTCELYNFEKAELMSGCPNLATPQKSNGTKTLFEKTYDGENIYDLGRDVSEAFMEEYNPILKDIPADIYGFKSGAFKVSVVWEGEQS